MKSIRAVVVAAAVAIAAISAFAGGSSCAIKSSDSFVLCNGGVTMMTGQGMSRDALRDLQQRYGAKFLWMRRGGKTYVVRDAATLDRAWAATQPAEELVKQQEELGSAAAAIGMKQAAIANSGEQRELAARQQQLAQRQQSLAKAQAQMSAESDRRLCEIGDEAIRSGKATLVQ